MCCTSTWPVNKQVLAFTLFVRNSSHHVYNDCSMKKRPINTAVVLEFRELLKWITKSYWNLSELSECKHICHRDQFIVYITLWVLHNSNKSLNKKTIHMLNCSTNCLCPIRIATNGSTSLLRRTSINYMWIQICSINLVEHWFFEPKKGKIKLDRIIGRFKKSRVNIQCLTGDGKLSLVRIIGSRGFKNGEGGVCTEGTNYKSIGLNIDFPSTYHQKNQFGKSNSVIFSSFLL